MEHFLAARRLVEAGARCVTVAFSRWDHHGDNFDALRQDLPLLDQGLTALLTDLHQRGLDKDVSVVVWGEFGRTPTINKDAGPRPLAARLVRAARGRRDAARPGHRRDRPPRRRSDGAPGALRRSLRDALPQPRHRREQDDDRRPHRAARNTSSNRVRRPALAEGGHHDLHGGRAAASGHLRFEDGRAARISRPLSSRSRRTSPASRFPSTCRTARGSWTSSCRSARSTARSPAITIPTSATPAAPRRAHRSRPAAGLPWARRWRKSCAGHRRKCRRSSASRRMPGIRPTARRGIRISIPRRVALVFALLKPFVDQTLHGADRGGRLAGAVEPA